MLRQADLKVAMPTVLQDHFRRRVLARDYGGEGESWIENTFPSPTLSERSSRDDAKPF